MMHRNQSVNVHQFAMIPQADVPRSSFDIQSAHKTTFDAGYLVPVYVDEVLPGDTFNLKMTAFARMSTPIYPLMDNMYLDSYRDWETDRKSTRLNSSHSAKSRMPSSA